MISGPRNGSASPRGFITETLPATNLKRVFKEALARLKTDKVKIFYLVTADSATPIESALSAVQKLHDEGLFGGRAHVHRILGCVRAGILGCVRAGMLQALR